MAFPNTSFIDGQTVIEADWLNAVNSKCLQNVSVLDYGAIGNGVADDTAAVQAAADYAKTLVGGTIVFPEGYTFNITSKISLESGVNLTGPGFILASTTQLFEWSNGAAYANTIVENITIKCNVAPPNDATGFGLFFNSLRVNRQTFSIKELRIASSDGLTRSYGFDTYIKINDIHYGDISNIYIEGCFKALAGNVLAGQYLQNGVWMTGVTTSIVLDSFNINAMYRGVYCSGSFVEGPRICNGDMVGVYYGIEAPAYNRPGFWIDGVHINAVRRCVYIYGAVDVTIRGMWLYRSNVFFADTDWTGISLENCAARTQISDVATSISITSDTQYGILLSNCTGVNAVNLALSQANRAIYQTGTNNNINYDNVVFNGLGTGTAFTTSATDTQTNLGIHKFLGSVGTRYSLGSTNPTVYIYTNRIKYPQVASTASIVTDGTLVLTLGNTAQLYYVNLGAGSAPYTYYIDLDTTNAFFGDFFDLRLNFPASANPTVIVRDSIGGSTLCTISPGVSKKYSCRFSYLGSWTTQYVCESLF